MVGINTNLLENKQVWECPFCESIYRYFFDSSDGNNGLAHHLFTDHKGQLTKRSA